MNEKAIEIVKRARAIHENLPEDPGHADRVQEELATYHDTDEDGLWIDPRAPATNERDRCSSLAVIDEIGAAFDAGDDPETAVCALGRALCEAAVLLWRHRLALTPVLELARIYGSEGEPAKGPSMLARVSRRWRYTLTEQAERDEKMVQALALTIAGGIDSCELIHDLTIDLAGLFVVMARESMGQERGPLPVGTRPRDTGVEHILRGPTQPMEMPGEGDPHARTLIAHGCLCPTCATPMSYCGGNLYGCGQHEHSADHLRALGVTEQDLERMLAVASTAETSVLS